MTSIWCTMDVAEAFLNDPYDWDGSQRGGQASDQHIPNFVPVQDLKQQIWIKLHHWAFLNAARPTWTNLTYVLSRSSR